MLEPANIAVEEGAEIAHAVFEHGEAVDPAAEGEALPLVGVEPAIGDDARMDHSAAQDLHPALVSADDPPALLDRPADIELRGGLGEGEIGRPKAHHDVVTLEEGFDEGLERPLQVAERDAPIDR